MAEIGVEESGSRFMSDESILVINTGSSSLKIGLYSAQDGDEGLLLDGLASGIGQSTATLELKDAQGRVLRSETLGLGSEGDALDRPRNGSASSQRTNRVPSDTASCMEGPDC